VDELSTAKELASATTIKSDGVVRR